MAGELDSARMAYFIAEALNVNPSDVHAMVLGGHGDEMVPVPQHTKVKGTSITELLPADKIEAINQRARDGGAEIVKYLKTGSAYYAPSASVVRMVRSILEDKNETIASCVWLTGQYGLKDVYCGVPAKLGRKGITEIVELPLTDKQKQELATSAQHVRENCDKVTLVAK